MNYNIYNKDKLQQENIKWIGEVIKRNNLRIFVTLTFKYDVSEIQANRTMSIFLNMLERQCFGHNRTNNPERKLYRVVIKEVDPYGNNLHYHLAIVDPERTSNRWEAMFFKDTIEYLWLKFSVSGNVHIESNESWFKKVYDVEGMAKYLCKTLKFGNDDFFDLENSKFD